MADGPSIIDFRVRPPFKSFADLTLFVEREEASTPPYRRSGLTVGRGPCESHRQRSMPLFLDEMEAAGISRAVVPGRCIPGKGVVPNSDIADLLEAHPDRFIGFGSIGPDELGDPAAAVSRFLAYGFKGVSVEGPWFNPPKHFDDPSFDEVYEACSDAGLVLMLTSSLYVGPDLSYSDPVHIQRVAATYPNLNIVVSHAAWPWTMALIGVAFRYPNVHIMPDLYGNTPGLPGVREWVDATNSFLGHRMIFGSAYPIRAMGESVAAFCDWPFASDELRDRCLGGNAARLLDIKPIAHDG
jgi:uncharacterized protein